jgi:hypothetical protein
MKARMLAETYQRVSQMLFYMMARFKITEDQLKAPRKENDKGVVWTPLPGTAECQLEMDETSVDALSGAMLRKMVPTLAKMGMASPKFTLQTLGVPHAEEQAAEAEQAQALSALSRLKKPR